MQINRVPAARGWEWVKCGLRLVKQQPLSVIAFTFMFMFLAASLAFLPLVGGFSPPFLTPLLSVGLMAAMRCVDLKEIPKPGLMFSPFKMGKPVWQALLILGTLNCLAYVVTLGISAVIDGGTWVEILLGKVKTTDPALKTSPWMSAAMLFFALYLPVQMAFWFAPLFVAWHNIKPVQSLFYSFVSVWRNKAAFVVYGLAWFAIALVFAMATQMLASMLGRSPVANIAIFPLLVLFLGAVLASMWATYKDVVKADDPTEAGLKVEQSE